MPGASKHIGAEPGDFAETVLIPGDPLRAKFIAETYLDDVRQITNVRNMLGFTGTYKGIPLSVMGSGMGQAGASIYFTELITIFGVKRLIRIGSCGTVLTGKGIRLGDLVLAQGAGTDSKMNRLRLLDHDHVCLADWELLSACANVCKEQGELLAQRGCNYHVSKVFSSDFFYHPQMDQLFPMLAKYGYAGIEMEAAALYGAASEYGCQALCLCTVSDEIFLPDETQSRGFGKKFSFNGMSSEDRETSLQCMMVVALETVLAVEKTAAEKRAQKTHHVD